jgi:hypothetical protein
VETQQHQISMDEPQLTKQQKDAAVNAFLISEKFSREIELRVQCDKKDKEAADLSTTFDLPE